MNQARLPDGYISPFSLSASIPTLEPACWVNLSLLALDACCCSSLPTVAALISAFGFVVQGCIWWLFKTQYSRNTGNTAGNEDIGTTYGLTLAMDTLRDGSLCIKVILIFSNLNLHLRTRDYSCVFLIYRNLIYAIYLVLPIVKFQKSSTIV